MNLNPKFLILSLAAFGLILSTLSAAPVRVLYFTKSSGYEHSVVKIENGQPSYSERILSKLGEANGFRFTFSKDGSKFSPEYFAGFDVIMFYTSGDLLSVGTDKNPAFTA